MSGASRCVRHEPCPECGSKDNLGRYDDGHGYCFGCGFYQHADGSSGTTNQQENRVSGLIHGEYMDLTVRCLSEDTCRHWKYQVGRYKGEPVQIANYCDADGVPQAQKIRFANKEFVVLGDLKKALPLYGQHLWRDGGKMVVITEGEIDALSVSQLQNNKWPVVSVPNGAKGAAKSIGKAIEWLEKFERVVFMFDMDAPGREAAKECAALLTPGKAFIASLPLKDANECLKNGKGSAVIDAMWSAKEFRPDGVVEVADLIEEAKKTVEIGVPWPWEPLTAKTYGIRTKELYGFGGGTGVGKTDLFKDVILHLARLGHQCGVLFLEENPAHTLKVLAGKYLGKRIHVPGVEYTEAEQDKAFAFLNGRVRFFRHFGAMDYETIKERIRYMVTALGCRYIFLDHLTALAAGIDDDERKAIDKIMADLASLAQQLDFALFYISHLTTPEGKPHEEGGRVLEKHFRGSRAIGFWSHFLFAVERDKQDQNGVTVFRVLKDRYTGDANGLTFGLRYDRVRGVSEVCELEDEDDEPLRFKNEELTGARLDF